MSKSTKSTKKTAAKTASKPAGVIKGKGAVAEGRIPVAEMKRVADALIAITGQTNAEVAKQLKCDPASVWDWRNEYTKSASEERYLQLTSLLDAAMSKPAAAAKSDPVAAVAAAALQDVFSGVAAAIATPPTVRKGKKKMTIVDIEEEGSLRAKVDVAAHRVGMSYLRQMMADRQLKLFDIE